MVVQDCKVRVRYSQIESTDTIEVKFLTYGPIGSYYKHFLKTLITARRDAELIRSRVVTK